MSDKEYLIALSTFNQFGPGRLKLLLGFFKSPNKIWNATKKDLLSIGLKENLVSKFIDHRSQFDLEKYFELLKKESVQAFTFKDEDYPANLKDLTDAPFVLYVKGNLKKADNRSVAIVGTRMPTSYGREIAKKFSIELANYGITVISGLALGIDAEAQRAALGAGGRTISVLASGLDIISPTTNKSLAMDIIKDAGAVISEYPIGHVPQTYDFPIRDRLISGMAKAVIVVEGRMKSGTFYTVQAAAEQGRPVFALPGQITSLASEGPNYLIQNGARLITNIREVLEELDLEFKVDTESVEKVFPSSPIEQKIVDTLNIEELHLDEVARITGIPIGELSARLTIMEMKGLVRNMGGGIYKRI